MSDLRDQAPGAAGDAAPYDALLLLSFGGPEGPDDVVPFLENVTRGRGIPQERLKEVGQHYFLFGGVSPINDQNRALLDALREDFAQNSLDLPVHWGNRNWAPYLTDTLREMALAGHRRILVLTTSAYASYSGCRQYRENLADALAALEAEGIEPPRVDKLRHYFNHPGFVRPMIDGVLASLAELPEEVRAGCPPRVHHALDPGRLRRHLGTRRGARRGRRLCARAPGRGPADRRRGARGDRRRAALGARLPVPLRRPAHPLAGAGHLRPPGDAARQGRARGRDGAHRLRLGPHGGPVRPGHRGHRQGRRTRSAGRAVGHGRCGPPVRRRRARARPGAGGHRARTARRALRPGRARPLARPLPGRLLPGPRPPARRWPAPTARTRKERR